MANGVMRSVACQILCDQADCCRYSTIFKIAANAILDFQKFKILTVCPMCVTTPNFIKIGEMVAEIWRFNSFKMAAACHLRFLKFKFFLGC